MKTGARPQTLIEALGILARQVPDPHFDTFGAFAAARCVMAGVSLGIFEAVRERPRTSEELAEGLQLDPQGTAVLLTALHSLDYLELRDGRYSPGRPVRKHLTPGAPLDLSNWVGAMGYDMWDYFGQLEESVRTGKPRGLHERPPDDPFWERYMRGLFDVSRLSASQLPGLVGARDPRSLLDLAGGHGGQSIAMCRRYPELRCTILELEGAAAIGRHIVAEEGYADRVTYVIGDIFESDLGGPHDVVMANNIAHHHTPEQNLAMARRARQALRPGGTMAIGELEAPEPGRKGDPIGTLTGMLFFISSRVRTYAAAELEEVLREAGFEDVRTRRHIRLPGAMVVGGRAPEPG